MGSSVADRKNSRAITTAVHTWVLIIAGLGIGIIAALTAAPPLTTITIASPASPATPATPFSPAAATVAETAAKETEASTSPAAATTSLWAVAYCVELRDAGFFRLVYAGYLRPVTAGKPAPTRIDTAPGPNANGAGAQYTGITAEQGTRTMPGWPDGITITAAELTAALRRGYGQDGDSLPPPVDTVGEGTVLLLLARPPKDGSAVGAAGRPPSSLLLIEPLVTLLDPEGTDYRRQLVADLLQRLGVPAVSYSSGPPPGAPLQSPVELPADPEN